MLQNESETTQIPAPGQMRVTPEELRVAVAAIEARKQADAQRLAETIPLSEAVSSLSLNATPEEIWAEVQAKREKETEAQQTSFAQAEAARREKLRQSQFTQPVLPSVKPFRNRPWKRFVGPAVALWVVFGSGIIPNLWHHSTHLSFSTAPTITATLSQIPAGKEVYCDTTTLKQLSEGKPFSQLTVEENNAPKNSWTLFKKGTHVYLRAFTVPITSMQAIQGQPLDLYNDDDSGDLHHITTAQTTIRVDNVSLQKSGGDDDYTKITVSNFQPDPSTTTSEWH